MLAAPEQRNGKIAPSEYPALPVNIFVTKSITLRLVPKCPTVRLQERGVSMEWLVVILEEIENKEPVPQFASVI
jgi:hypothetical protein